MVYEGPIRTIVATGSSDIAKASDDHAEHLISIVELIFSSVIGEIIPLGGLVFRVIEGTMHYWKSFMKKFNG